MLDDPSLAPTVVGIVDCALQGSEYAVEAWNILRKCIRASRKPTLDEIDRVFDLYDLALDDIQDPCAVTVDLTRDKVYA